MTSITARETSDADLLEPAVPPHFPGDAVARRPQQGQVNQVAAVPSLHTAFAVLTCLVLLAVARRAGRTRPSSSSWPRTAATP